MSRKHIATETEVHQAAWQFYLAAGPDRTLQKVAAHFDIAPTTAKVWARSFGWAQRIVEHEAQVARRTIDLAEKQGVEVDARAKARNLKIVQGAMLRLAQALGTGDVKFALSDLPRLVQLEQALMGDGASDKSAGPSVDSDLEGKSSAELWALLAAEWDAVHRIAAQTEEVAALVQAGKLKPFRPLPFTGRCPTCGHLPESEVQDEPTPAKTL